MREIFQSVPRLMVIQIVNFTFSKCSIFKVFFFVPSALQRFLYRTNKNKALHNELISSLLFSSIPFHSFRNDILSDLRIYRDYNFKLNFSSIYSKYHFAYYFRHPILVVMRKHFWANVKLYSCFSAKCFGLKHTQKN